jgi:hypothetical protein
MSTEWFDIAEYESIRVMTETHKLRFSHHAKLIQSGPNQTLVLSARGPYVCYRIVESGLEIPVNNVASAVPKAASLAGKMRRTTGSRTKKPTTESDSEE